MISVQSKVPILEMDGKDVSTDSLGLNIFSHANWDTLVVLVLGTKTVTVKVSDLRAAIDNATNTAKF